MKIAVCIKHVPDTTIQPRIKDDKSGVDLSSINKFAISPYDEYGLTEAVALAGKHSGEVTVLTVGNDKAQESLRKALAMGAQHAIHIKTGEATDLPGLTTAKLLAEQLKAGEFDLIFFGMKAVDDELAMVGPAVAALLERPVVDSIHGLDVADDAKSAVAKRETADGTEAITVRFPAVLTTNKGLNTPKPPSLPAIMKAKKVSITAVDAAIGELPITVKSVDLPPERGDVQMLSTDGDEAVGQLVDALKKDVKVL